MIMSQHPRRATLGALVCLAVCTGTAFAVPALAGDAILYVDKGAASCSDSGPGSASRPFCTLAKSAAVAKPGTTVLVRGGTYTEQLTPKVSGIAGSPVTFQAAPGENVVLQGAGAYGVYVSGRSYVSIRGFNVTGTVDIGIYVKGSDHVIVDGNHVSYAGQPVNGYTARGITMNTTVDSVIRGNLVDHNSDSGIYVGTGSTRDTVIANETTANARGYTRAAPGIDIRAVGNSVLANRSYANEDSGIQIRTGGDQSLVVGNVVWRNGDHGIDVLQAPGCRIIGNTAYLNTTAGINDEGDAPGSTGAVILNNISVENGINSPRTEGQIRVDKSSTDGTVVDGNLVYQSSPGYLMQWGATKFTSLAAFQAGSGQEAHGIQAAPQFVDAANNNFRLAAGSPAIDSANSGADGTFLVDLTGQARVDDPAVANTGLGARSFDDRGAYERNP